MTGRPYRNTGFSLIEALIALALTATIAGLAIGVLVKQNPKSQISFGRSANDFITHLSTACKKAQLEYGAGPLAAKTIGAANCPAAKSDCYLYAYPKTAANNRADTPKYSYTGADNDALRGFAWLLKNWESTVTYDATTESLAYPDSIVLYLQPDMNNATVDPSNEIPNDNTGLPAGGLADNLDDIMYNTYPNPDLEADDRQFVLLDMNGTAAPNSIGVNGDRVLLYIEDNTCRIQTAYVACRDGFYDSGTAQPCHPLSGGTTPYGQSFYDVYKCTEATAQGVGSKHCNPQT